MPGQHRQHGDAPQPAHRPCRAVDQHVHRPEQPHLHIVR
jgi:hypothetical protein